jgi:hypothetical protein
LLDEAKISGKKSQKKHLKNNDKLLKRKKIEINITLEENREDIGRVKLVVYRIDECHLLWGDVCVYSLSQ